MSAMRANDNAATELLLTLLESRYALRVATLGAAAAGAFAARS